MVDTLTQSIFLRALLVDTQMKLEEAHNKFEEFFDDFSRLYVVDTRVPIHHIQQYACLKRFLLNISSNLERKLEKHENTMYSKDKFKGMEGITDKDFMEALKAPRYFHRPSQKDKEIESLKASLEKHEEMINFLLAEVKSSSDKNQEMFDYLCAQVNELKENFN